MHKHKQDGRDTHGLHTEGHTLGKAALKIVAVDVAEHPGAVRLALAHLTREHVSPREG